MEWYEVGLGLFSLLLVFIAIGLPIPFALAAASLPFLWEIQSFSTSLVRASASSLHTRRRRAPFSREAPYARPFGRLASPPECTRCGKSLD